MSQLFAWAGQSIGVSASAPVLPMNTQGWSTLGFQIKSRFSSGVILNIFHVANEKQVILRHKIKFSS